MCSFAAISVYFAPFVPFRGYSYLFIRVNLRPSAAEGFSSQLFVSIRGSYSCLFAVIFVLFVPFRGYSYLFICVNLRPSAVEVFSSRLSCPFAVRIVAVLI
jgi:hypothetical protein